MFTEAANFNEKDSDLSTAYRFGKLVYQAINTTNSYGLSQNNSVTGGAPGEFLIFFQEPESNLPHSVLFFNNVESLTRKRY